MNGHPSIAELSLKNGAKITIDVHPDGNYGQTALHETFFNSHSEVTKLLLDSGASTTVRYRWGQTALDLVAAIGSADQVKILLGKGANLKHDDGWKALKKAIKNDRMENVEVLISGGVDLNFHPQGQKSLLDNALERGCL